MHTVGRNAKMYSCYWKQCGSFSKKLEIELPYDPAILLLSIYPKELKLESQRDICTSMFPAALFTKTKVWKQTKSLSADKWIKEVWYEKQDLEWILGDCWVGCYTLFWDREDQRTANINSSKWNGTGFVPNDTAYIYNFWKIIPNKKIIRTSHIIATPHLFSISET